MAERSEKARERVREELGRNPGASTTELQEAAQSVEPSIGELSLRQFNAGYVLPLKRKRSAGAKKGKGGAPRRQTGRRQQAAPPAKAPKGKGRAREEAPRASEPEGERERVRATLMEFARDFSEADSRSAIVGVLSDLDRYVDRIIGARG